MSEIDDLYPPAQYGGGWLLLACGIIALAVAIALVVLWCTRPRYSLTQQRDAEVEPAIDAEAITQALRNEYLVRLQHVQDAYTSGQLNAREANRTLSRVVRQFVQDYSGFEAPVLALNDLIALGVPHPLIDALQRHYYPSIFARTMVIDPHAGVQAARLVVTTWH